MLRLECKILIADGFVFNYANLIEIEESSEDLTVKCTIRFPKKNGVEENEIVNGTSPLFKRGDRVQVYMGYFPELKKAFDGFISDVALRYPMEIKCEDGMFTLKQTPARKFTGENVTLRQLLTAILPAGYVFNTIDANVGDWRVSGNAVVTNVLDELRSNHAIYSRFVEGVLYVGLYYQPELQNTETFYFEKNIINCDNLDYQLKENVKVKVKVNAFRSDNKKVVPYEIGDLDGDLRTINLYNVPAADVEAIALKEIDRLKYTGYKGDFETFGEPFVRPGDAAKLISTLLPERNGTYLINSVTRSWGVEGYRQTIGIDAILNTTT